MPIRYEITQFGFNWGAAVIERLCDNEKTGSVCLSIRAGENMLSIYVTKSGKFRVFDEKTGKELKEV